MSVLKMLGKATVARIFAVVAIAVFFLFIAANIYAVGYIGDALLYFYTGTRVDHGTTGYHLATGFALVVFWIGFIVSLTVMLDNKTRKEAPTE